MGPPTRSSGTPSGEDMHSAPVTPKNGLKRDQEDDVSESDRESKRTQTAAPQTAPHTRIFGRGNSFVARNRARWQRDGLFTPQPERFGDRSAVQPLRPLSIATPSKSKQNAPGQPEPKKSTVNWLLGIPSLLFSPSKASSPPASSQPNQPSETNTEDVSNEITAPPKPNVPELTPIEKARQQLRYKRRALQRKKEQGKSSVRGLELLQRKLEDEEREVDAREAEEFATEQVEGSKKRKLAPNTFTLVYSDEEDEGEDEDENDKETPHSPIAEAVACSQALRTPLKSAMKSGPSHVSNKKLRINETPTRVKTLYRHYGAAGEYTGSTFADKFDLTRNSFSPLSQDLRTEASDDSSIPTDPQAVRHKVLSPTTKIHTHLNSMPASAAEKNPFRSIKKKKGEPFVQPNSFHVPYLDDPSDDESECAEDSPENQDDGQAKEQENKTPPASTSINTSASASASTFIPAPIFAAPATPRMSHAQLPETQSLAEVGSGSGSGSGSAQTQDEQARNKESEDAALKKVREAAQKYKPKTSSRLSTFEAETQVTAAVPKTSSAFSINGDSAQEQDKQDKQATAAVPKTSSAFSINGNPAQEQDKQVTAAVPKTSSAFSINGDPAQEQDKQDTTPGNGPHPAPYTWTKPPKQTYSNEAPDYEPWTFDDTHVGLDGMTDKQRRAARDAAADAWVAENVKWPEAPTYVDAGLCSNYIDNLMETEVCPEGKERTEKIMGQQFDEILKWAYEEKAKGNRCALTWNNGREELVW